MTKFRLLRSILLSFQGSVTDNCVFRLHYKLTLPVLLALSILVAFRMQFGTAINCTSNDVMSASYVNDHCYTASTFSVVESWNQKVGEEIPYPGVSKDNPDHTRVYHYYYKWVSYVLFLQALMFLVPMYFWKAMESGRIYDMVSELKIPSDETPKLHFQLLSKQIASDFGFNRRYFVLYWVAEMLNAVNVIGQIFLMDAFLNGQFLSYGYKVLEIEKDSSDPMLRVFPRITKCIIHSYGSSGFVQRHSAMCLLPINILNEKIYLFLWFWFIILAILSCLAVVYRGLIFISHKLRMCILMLRTRSDAKPLLDSVLENRGAGDWFIIYLLNKNMRPSYFRDLVSNLAEETEYVESKFL